MRFEFQCKARDLVVPGHNRRIYCDRIEPGWILTVEMCYLHVPEIGVPDVISIIVERGPEELIVRSRGKETGRQGISALCPFYVGEYQRIIGYAPNAEIGDELSLSVMGYLMPLWDWRGLTSKGG